MNKNKSKKLLILISLMVIVLIVILDLYDNPHNIEPVSTIAPIYEASSTSLLNSESSEEQIKESIDSSLVTLLKIHNISQKDIETVDPNSLIIDMLQESMNDVNKLNRVLSDTDSLVKSENKVISTTGMSLNVTAKSLITSYTSWIQYLRTVDINNLDVKEFQYQLSLFQTSTHDAYLNLIEGASLLPVVVINFENENASGTVNLVLKNYFSTRIDELFKDILIEDDRYHLETKNRYTVAVIIREYKKFLK